MTICQEFEAREASFLSPHGCLSSHSQGRVREEAPCPIRTNFQRDRDRIVYSNAFRRLKHKTQVFLSPLGDHYRTRLTHTLEVAGIARTICRAMRLNEDLAEAIAMGHDLGHTPFGHSGETALKEIYASEFSHNEQSLRVVDVIENNGKGLNLTFEVRDGILKHSKGYGKVIPDNPEEKACTVEGQVVRIADIMAYLNHDLDDAVRSRVIDQQDVPPLCREVLGNTHSGRATTMMRDIVYASTVDDGILTLRMSDAIYDAMTGLRQFLYDRVYRSGRVHKEFFTAKKILSELYTYFLEHDALLEKALQGMEMGGCWPLATSRERIACDFIASLTDRHALNLYNRIFIPSPQV